MYDLLTSPENGITDDEFLIPYISQNSIDIINANITYARQHQSEGKVRKWSAFLRMALENNYGFSLLVTQHEQKLAEEKRRKALLVDPLTGELTKEGKLAEQQAAYEAEQEQIKKQYEDVKPMNKEIASAQAKAMMDALRKNQ